MNTRRVAGTVKLITLTGSTMGHQVTYCRESGITKPGRCGKGDGKQGGLRFHNSQKACNVTHPFPRALGHVSGLLLVSKDTGRIWYSTGVSRFH
jgi:hypothetical protein